MIAWREGQQGALLAKVASLALRNPMNLRNSGAVVVANYTGCNRWWWQRAVGAGGNMAGGARDGRAGSVALVFGVTKVQVASDQRSGAALGLV